MDKAPDGQSCKTCRYYLNFLCHQDPRLVADAMKIFEPDPPGSRLWCGEWRGGVDEVSAPSA